MKTSFRKLLQFEQAAESYTQRRTGETKLDYAIKKLSDKFTAINTAFTERLQAQLDDVRIDHCLTDPPDDPNGKIVRDSAYRYVFTKEGEKACKKELKKVGDALLDMEDIEIVPYFATQIPDDLTETELEAFSGLVIKPEQVEAILKERETKLSIVPDEKEEKVA